MSVRPSSQVKHRKKNRNKNKTLPLSFFFSCEEVGQELNW